MTAIVAIKEGGEIWIGSETLCSDEMEKAVFGPKLIQTQYYTLGFAGTIRVAQALEAHLKRSKINPSNSTRAIDLANFIGGVLDKYGLITKDDEKNPQMNAEFILATKDNIICIMPDFSVLFNPEIRILACGSGKFYAYGAYHVLKDSSMPVVDKLQLTIKAAIAYNPFCGGDIYTVRMSEAKKKKKKR